MFCILSHKGSVNQNYPESQAWWLTHAILATWEAEIRRIAVRGQLGKKVSEIPFSTNKSWAR
jgi:hypothetical protein